MTFTLKVFTWFVIVISVAVGTWSGFVTLVTLFVRGNTARETVLALAIMIGCLLAARWLYLLSGGAL